jgi:hypothetical protein
LQIVINIEKKHLYAFVLLIGLFGSFAYAYNSGGTGGNPSVMGHSFDEMGGGTMELGAVNCNVYDLGEDCAGQISGIVIQGQPDSSSTLLSLRDKSPSVPGGDALVVDGNAIFKCTSGECQISFPDLVEDAAGGTWQLCIISDVFNADNGRVVLC